MTGKEIIEMHERSLAALKSEIDWLTATQFTIGSSSTQNLVDENLRLIEMYDALIAKRKAAVLGSGL